MRRLGAIVAFVLVAAPVAFIASGGRALSDDDCKALSRITTSIPDVSAGSSAFNRSSLQSVARGLRKTARELSDKKLAKSLKTLASIYSAMAGADSNAAAAVVFAKNAKRWAKAWGAYTSALAACVTSSITLPTSITLPGGATITIPR